MFHGLHADFSAFTTDHAHNRWPIVIERPVTWALIAAATGRILRVRVRNPFLARVLEHLVHLRDVIW